MMLTEPLVKSELTEVMVMTEQIMKMDATEDGSDGDDAD